MKRSITLKILMPVFICSSTLSAHREKDPVFNSIAQKVNKISQVNGATYVITTNNIGKTGYTITKPGTYRLAEDIIFDPATPAAGGVVAAITINSSNVSLDLGNHHIVQRGAGTPSQAPYGIGILIPDIIPNNTDVNAIGLQSIYIFGEDQAVIDGFSMYGIRVLGHTYDIRISDVTIKNTGLLASKAVRSQNSALASYVPNGAPCSAVDGSCPVLSTNPFGIAGLAIGESDLYGMGPVFFTQRRDTSQFRAREVVLNNVACLNNFFMGLCVSNTDDIVINESHFDNTFSDDPAIYTAGAAFGPALVDTEFPSVNRMVVQNSTFNKTFFDGDFTTPGAGWLSNIFIPGAILGRSTNLIFRGCQFNDTLSTFAGMLPSVLGAATATATSIVIDGCLDLLLEDCSFDGSTGVSAANGLHMSGHDWYGPSAVSCENVIIRNCTANNISQIGDRLLPEPVTLGLGYDVLSPAIGFETSYAKNITFENCSADNIVCYGPLNANVYVGGFQVTGGTSSLPDQDISGDSTLFKNCRASRIITSQGGNAVGYLVNHQGGPLNSVSFENCFATSCKALVPTINTDETEQGAAVGFWSALSNGGSGSPTTFKGCSALNNQGASYVVNNAGAGTAENFGNVFSAGFLVTGFDTGTPGSTALTSNHFYDCQAVQNVYGFLLCNVDACTVRNCRADNNVSIYALTDTGGGFFDLGDDYATDGVGASASVFEGNHAYNNANATDYFGDNTNYNINPVPPLLLYPVDNPLGITPINPMTYFAGVHNISSLKTAG